MPPQAELFRALGALCERPDPAHARLAAALGLPGTAARSEYTDLFVLQLVPYASVYTSTDGMLGGEPADRVAGFWRALHLTPPAEPDHLAALLGLYAALIDQEHGAAEAARAALWRHARQVLLWEHLLTWVPAYLAAVGPTGAPFYAAWARLLAGALEAEAREHPAAGAPGAGDARPPGDRERTPDTGDLTGMLLAPARSGMIITRADLVAGARAAGTGVRMGERAFALRSMLQQDPVATLDWLAGQANRWHTRHESAEPVLGEVARRWRDRAGATLRLLDRTRETVMEESHA